MLYDPALEIEFVLRIVLAGALSAALGFERERAGKAAGLRTHMVVGIAAALFVVTGILATLQFPDQSRVVADPGRAIYAIVVGIGFLGSGVVFVSKAEDKIPGLTTAAAVWGTAAIGTAAGFGLYVLATFTTVLLLIVLRLFKRFERPGQAE